MITIYTAPHCQLCRFTKPGEYLLPEVLAA